MLHWAKDGGLPVHVLLTKADKLKRGAQKTALLQTKKQLQALELPFSIQLFSALNKQGLDELADVLGDWLHLGKNPSTDEHLDHDESHNEPSTQDLS